MVHYKLRYFDVRGLGESIRQIFALAGQKFEDERQPLVEWESVKNREMFGQLPILFVDGEPLGQSSAIARYLARKFDLAGKGDWEEAQVDAIAAQFGDFLNEVKTFTWAKIKYREGDVDKLREEVLLPGVKKHIPFLVNFLKKSGSGFLVGQSVTWVDLFVAEFIRTFLTFEEGLFDQYPEVIAHMEKIHSIPNIQKWRAERPVTAI